MNEEQSRIIELFRFDQTECKLFPYLDEYSKELRKRLETTDLNGDQLFRYMLVGLFPEYRATNHHGDNFHTITSKWSKLDARPKTREQLEQINKTYGREIETTTEYIDLLGLKTLNQLTGQKLFEFVINGSPLG